MSQEEIAKHFNLREDGLFSKRELQIVKMIPEGKSNREIGLTLGIATKTVENHVRTILNKAQCRNRVVLAVKWVTKQIT
jgi:DNA-binding NarL/FixJ family response regulator